MLACFIALLAHQTSSTITYTNFGARTEVILSDLSRLTGQALTADASVRDVPLTLRLDHAPAAKALLEIATAVAGRWLASGDKSILVYDPNTFEKQEAFRHQRLVNSRILGIHQWIATTRKEYQVAQDAIAKGKEAYRDEEGVALARVIESIGIDDLADIGDRYATVFGFPARPLMHPFPDLTAADFAALTSDVQRDEETKESKAHYMVRIIFKTQEDELQATVIPVDQYGQSLRRSYTRRLSPDFDPPKVKSKGHEEEEEDSPRLPPPSPTLKALLDDEEDADTLPASVMARLRDPINFDPTQYLGEFYVGYAQVKKAQLVAVLDPSERQSLGRGDRVNLGRRVGFDQIQDFLHRDGAEFSGDWIMLPRQADPLTGNPAMPTQRLLAQFLKNVDNKIDPSFDQTLALYRNGFSRVKDQVNAEQFFGQPFLDSYQSSLKFVELYDCLSDLEVAALKDGKTLPVASLSQAAKDLIVSEVFQGYGYLELDEDAVQARGVALDSSKEAQSYNLYTRPYEFLSKALPDDAKISFSIEDSPAIKPQIEATDAGSSGYYDGSDGNLTTYISYALENHKEPPAMLGVNHLMTLNVRYSPYSFRSFTADFSSYPDGKYVALKDWPASLLEDYRKQRAEAEEERKKEAEEETNTPPPVGKPR